MTLSALTSVDGLPAVHPLRVCLEWAPPSFRQELLGKRDGNGERGGAAAASVPCQPALLVYLLAAYRIHSLLAGGVSSRDMIRYESTKQDCSVGFETCFELSSCLYLSPGTRGIVPSVGFQPFRFAVCSTLERMAHRASVHPFCDPLCSPALLLPACSSRSYKI